MVAKTVVVYFSKDGNTRIGATLLAKRVDAKLVELKEAKKGNFIQALLKKASPLQGDPWSEILGATKVYLMLPIWASNGVPAMNAFLAHADFTAKQVVVITFQQFKDLRNSHKVHDYVEQQVKHHNGVVTANYAFLGANMGHCATENEIEAQLKKIPEYGKIDSADV